MVVRCVPMTSKKKKKLVHDVINTSATYMGLVHGVTDLVKMIALKAVFGDLLLKKKKKKQKQKKQTQKVHLK